MNGMAMYLLLLLVACGAPTLSGPDQADRTGETSVAELLAATGPFEVGVVPGPVIVLQGERVSLERFREYAVSSGLPLKDRKALIKAHPDVKFSAVREIIKTLKLGECVDIKLNVGFPLAESTEPSTDTP